MIKYKKQKEADKKPKKKTGPIKKITQEDIEEDFVEDDLDAFI